MHGDSPSSREGLYIPTLRPATISNLGRRWPASADLLFGHRLPVSPPGCSRRSNQPDPPLQVRRARQYNGVADIEGNVCATHALGAGRRIFDKGSRKNPLARTTNYGD
jgi:hypothetical protein